MTPPPAPVLSAQEVSKAYPHRSGDRYGCRDVILDVRPGEFVVLRGRSGAGKTTLLNLLGGLDRPTSGRVTLLGADLATLPDVELSRLRQERLGFVFQSFGLLSVLSAAENVEVPLRIARVRPAERTQRVTEALELVGLTRFARQRPGELSGGQQQRVGIARALVNRPQLLLADEPTAQLDSAMAAGIVDLLAALVADRGMAAVVSTHQAGVLRRATRLLEISDGRVVEASQVHRLES